jgi:membrane protein DedA with SNARE-associated domain
VPTEALIYWLLKPFGVLVAAGFGLHPIPEEVIVVYAGVDTAVETRFGAYRWLMLPTCMVGSVIADIVLYWVGRFFGARLLEHRWLARLAPAEKRERTRHNFERYGVWILVFGRLVPGIRTTLFLTSGMMRLPMSRFILADGLGAILGNSLFFILGFLLGHQFAQLFEAIEQQVSAWKHILILILLVGVAGYLLYLFLRRPFPTGDPEDLPLIGHQVATHIPVRHDSTATTTKDAAATKPPEGETTARPAPPGEGIPSQPADRP